MVLSVLAIVPADAGAVGLPVPSVGPATVEATSDAATVTVPVTPFGVSSSWQVEYGLTTAYSAASAPIAIPLTGPLTPMTTTLTGLLADGHYHYRSVITGPWTMPLVTADATFDTATAAVAVDDGIVGIESGGDDGQGSTSVQGVDGGDAPGPGAPAPAPGTPTRTMAPTPATTPARTPSPVLPRPSTAPRASVTARGGAVAVALSGAVRAVTLTLPARATVRARLSVTTAGRTRSATLRGTRVVRIGAARAVVRGGRIRVSALPARTTALRLTPSAGITLTARQATATAA